ncbi:MAG: lysine--tRNA ligase [Deltaproteobacteria bacterium]|jgi:lysyl-tRNA synthetase class 1|nr:lysine--tRNA ligase [Deltaproteobacteria bacterium]
MARKYKSWPFREAQRIIKAAGRDGPPDDVIFETGFGPSGLPHIGTFAEVARTTWVRRAYEQLTGKRTRLVAFSDDLDGLRKVPDNLPEREMLREHLGKPLSDIPDPYGCCESFSGHMNGKLGQFLDTYGFDYEFRSSAAAYRAGDFDRGLKILLANVDKVLEIILPTLSEENRSDWSPFFPRCEACGKVYTTRVTAYHHEDLAVSYSCDNRFGEVEGCGHRGVSSVLGGAAKVGWKVDWALRWFCYDVRYEMYGKDLIPSAELSSRIVRVMGGQPPCGFFYEMFLDENGEKISKSRGNGVAVEEWLEYAPVESLAYFIYRDPRQAKKLHFDIIPKNMDEYLEHLRRYPEVAEDKRPDVPVWHIHDAGRSVPRYDSDINFSMVGNLVSALGQPEPELLRGFLERYDDSTARNGDVIDTLIAKGIRYYEDHILPNKRYREPSDDERALFADLDERLAVPGIGDLDEKALQGLIFDIARAHDSEPREFFSAIYQVLLGQERGPRFGTFARLVGVDRVRELIAERVS